MEIRKTERKVQIGDILDRDSIVARGEPGQYFDADTGALVADYRPHAAVSLRETAWKLRGRQIAGNGKENFPTELQPWADLVETPAICGLVTENFPPMPVHVDNWTGQGETPGRTTMLTIYREGAFEGGEYVLAEYGLAFDMRDGDVLLSPTQNLHGNVPRLDSDGYVRLSCILCLDGKPTAAVNHRLADVRGDRATDRSGATVSSRQIDPGRLS